MGKLPPSPSDIEEGILSLEQAVEALSDWVVRAILRLDANKTKAILFGSPVHVNNANPDISLLIRLEDSTSIPFSDSVLSLVLILCLTPS